MTSFPYLKIATEHRVPYGDVIRFVQFLDRMRGFPDGLRAQPGWQRDVAMAWVAEQERRRQVESETLTQALTVG